MYIMDVNKSLWRLVNLVTSREFVMIYHYKPPRKRWEEQDNQNWSVTVLLLKYIPNVQSHEL